METPDSERTTGSRMAEEQGGQPSVGRREGAQGDVPQRLDDVRGVQGVHSNSENVDNNLNKTAEAAGTSSSIIRRESIRDVGPSSPKGGTGGGGEEVAIRIDDEDTNSGLDEGRSSGAEGRAGGHDEENLLHEGDPPRQQQQDADDDRSLQDGNATKAAGAAVGADTTVVQQFRSSAYSFSVPPRFPLVRDKSGEHFIDIPLRTSSKGEELDAFKRFGIVRTLSNFSRASFESGIGDQCRICQQHSEEPLMELGCQCRGELAKAHRSCVDHWFGNKGTNKCEVCQHVATNVPPPSSQPTPHFWVWRVGGPYNSTARRGGGARFHPLWAALLILIAGLLFDILISIFLGASALPVNIIIGVLVVLGLGTAARLVLECWHERVIRRNIQRMEEEPNFEDFPPEHVNNIDTPTDPVEGPASTIGPSPGTAAEQQGAAEASVTASVAATAAPDVENR